MTEHPRKTAIVEIAEWHDRWRGDEQLEPLVEAVREAWIEFAADSNPEMIFRSRANFVAI